MLLLPGYKTIGIRYPLRIMWAVKHTLDLSDEDFSTILEIPESEFRAIKEERQLSIEIWFQFQKKFDIIAGHSTGYSRRLHLFNLYTSSFEGCPFSPSPKLLKRAAAAHKRHLSAQKNVSLGLNRGGRCPTPLQKCMEEVWSSKKMDWFMLATQAQQQRSRTRGGQFNVVQKYPPSVLEKLTREAKSLLKFRLRRNRPQSVPGLSWS